MKSGNDFIVKIGKKKITLKSVFKDEYNKITLKNPNGKISVYNDWKKWNGTENDDKFENSSNKVSLYAKGGNDSISNNGDKVTISADAGNDSISNSGDKVTIFGGAGNDFISNNGKNAVIKYASGDGNDTISGFNSDDTLHITKGSYSTKVNGNDVIVTVGKGTITLKDAAGEKISIKNSKGKVTTKTYEKDTSALFKSSNFVTADNLSEIVKNDLSPAAFEKITTTNYENLMQENNFVTYSEK